MKNTKLRVAMGCAVALVVTGCKNDHFDILNTNNPALEDLEASPNRLTLGRLALGSAYSMTNDVQGEVTVWGTFGREGYNLLGNDPRLTNEMVRGPLDPGGVGGGQWLSKFIALRTINIYLSLIDQAPDGAVDPVLGLTTAEKSASKGYANTLRAILLHRLVLRNGRVGIPVDVQADLSEEPAPFVSESNAYDRIIGLLDEAYADLQAGGGGFPFSAPPGYENFATPASFAQFNRAYYAKVQIHRATFLGAAGAYGLALTALGQSFVDPAGSLSAGATYGFSSASGDIANPVAEPTTAVRYYIHSSLETEAQLKGNGQKDDRFTRKTAVVTPRSQNDLTANLKPIMYNTPGTLAPDLDADIPLLKNEEVLLLRAEARWFTGDKTGAIEDLNTVRTRSGGLNPTTLTAGSTDAAFVTELIYNRRYSLLWEQGTTWHDARRFGRESTLPNDRGVDVIFDFMTVPATECDARGLAPPCDDTVLP